MDYDLIAHTCSSREILRILKEQDAQIKQLQAEITRLQMESEPKS